MDFNWSTSESNRKAVTITESNITLNTNASKHFQNVSYVLLGVNSEQKLGIKPVDKEAINNNYYPKEQLHHLSVGKSYMRVSNKSFIRELNERFDLGLDSQKSIKLSAHFDVVHQILLVDLK